MIARIAILISVGMGGLIIPNINVELLNLLVSTMEPAHSMKIGKNWNDLTNNIHVLRW
jgi:hypothetical protein